MKSREPKCNFLALGQALLLEAGFRAMRFGSHQPLNVVGLADGRYLKAGFDCLADFGFPGRIEKTSLPYLTRIVWWSLVTSRKRIPASFWPLSTRAEIEDSWQAKPGDVIPVRIRKGEHEGLQGWYGRLGVADAYGDRYDADQSRVVKYGDKGVEGYLEEVRKRPDTAVLLDVVLERVSALVPRHAINEFAERKQRERHEQLRMEPSS